MTNLHFKTHAQLKNVIGQDLINDDNIAVIELVKNAYDARSGKVELSFNDVATTGSDAETTEYPGEIVIRDWSTGMSESDIVDKWLNIAYSDKRDREPGEPAFAGNKGVGRFACDRLGKYLDMYTRKSNGPVYHVNVDWTDFEKKTDKDYAIHKINISVEKISNTALKKKTGIESLSKGTVLRIRGLRSAWDHEKLISLRRNLERFVNPNALFQHGGFSIVLNVPAFRQSDRGRDLQERVNGTIQNRIFEKLQFRTTYIDSYIDESGKEIETTLSHDGLRVYRIVERNADFPLLPGTRISVHYMNPYKKAYFKRETGLHTVEFGSIFLFVNGFRISPYGDRNDDWLGLDNRKGQGTSRYLGNRELLGRIEVRDKANRFRIVSNREGIVQNSAFKQLVLRDGFFYRALRRLERFVVEGLGWDSVPEDVRKRLESGALVRDKADEKSETYEESSEKKTRRIARDVLRIVGAEPSTTISLEIDPELLDNLAKEQEDEVKAMLEKFDDFGDSMQGGVKRALNRVREQFEKQRAKLAAAERTVARKEKQVARLQRYASQKRAEAEDLKKSVSKHEQQILFLKSVTSLDQDQLILFHHQIGINADAAKNYLERIISDSRSGVPQEKIFDHAERAIMAVRKIIAVSQFATKANFRMKTQVITADLAAFVEQYIDSVAREFSASNIHVNVKRTFNTPFTLAFKPIDLAIIFDNLASNAIRAKARTLDITLSLLSKNEIEIKVEDDGQGISKEIDVPESVFEKGITTTRGSGLGLYHVKQTVESMGGRIGLDLPRTKGFGVVIRLLK